MLKISGTSHDNELMHVYFKFRDDAKVYRTKEISPLVMVDYDKDGKLIGIEFSDPKDYGMEPEHFETDIKIRTRKRKTKK